MRVPALLSLFGLGIFTAICLAQPQAPAPGPTAPAANRPIRWALVIGNSSYSAAPISTGDRDAKAVADSLRVGGFNVTDVRNASLERMKSAIDEFASKVAPNSVALVYFSGYGLRVDSANYLLPVDFDASREDRVPARAFPLATLQTALQSSAAKARIVVLDACRDYPFPVARKSPGLAPLDSVSDGTLIAFASGAVKTSSLGGSSPGIGLFPQTFAASLPTQDLQAMFRKVKQQVATTTLGEQDPALYGDLGGVFSSFPIRVGDNVQAAHLIQKVPPVYPPDARKARVQGNVRFRATIGPDGTIQNLTLVEGHPLLVDAAREAVQQWVYQPTTINGSPVTVLTTIDVNFTLNTR